MLSLVVATSASAQPSGTDRCEQPTTETETLSAGINAEINDHGDLLLLLDTDQDGEPERVLHGAPRHPDELPAIVDELREAQSSLTVRFLSNSPVAYSGFEIIDERGNVSLRALNGAPECYPQDSESGLWLDGLAHYTLSNFEPLAKWTVKSLREESLGPDKS